MNSRVLPSIVVCVFFLAAGPTNVAAAVEDGLVAHWPLDEGDGQVAADVTNNGHDLQLAGVHWVQGAIGRGLDFAAGRSRASTALSDQLQPLTAVTAAAWVYVDSFGEDFEGIGIVNNRTSYVLRISGGPDGPVPSFHIYSDGWAPVFSPYAISDAEWYHMAGTYDGEYMSVYVNGRLMARRPRTGPIHPSEGSLQIGRQVAPLDGRLDEVRIYDRALSAQQVAALFAQDQARLNEGVQIGSVREPYEDLFGKTRDHPAPTPTLSHLPDADLTFAVITDTHIGVRGQEAKYCHNWRVKEAIRQINAIRPEFVAHCGDIITAFPFHDMYEQQCRYATELLGQFDMPVHLVAGNHDIGNQRNMRVWGEAWEKRTGKDVEVLLFQPAYREVYRSFFGDDFHSFEQDGCKFIVFNDEICNSDTELDREQMDWLRSQLAEGRDAKAIFVFTHNPLFWNQPEDLGPENYEPVLEPARSQLLSLLADNNVTAVYTGHTHFPFANQYGDVWMRTLDSTTFNRNFPGVRMNMSAQAWLYDPYKLGFLVVRVRDGRFHETWVPTYWRVPDPPQELGDIAGDRVVGRAPTETGDSVLGIRAVMPTPVQQTDRRQFDLVNDMWWRLAENIGSTWTQVWPLPDADEQGTVERALTLGRPRGSKIALPLPAEEDLMQSVWGRLDQYGEAISALVVCNGAPSGSGPLTSWEPKGGPDDWARACERAGRLAGDHKAVALARLPLIGTDALSRIETTSQAIAGQADALCVWATTQQAPEQGLLGPLARAAQIARDNGLELWLDIAAWQRVAEPRRSTYFLRLLAWCEANGVRVFWWIGPDDNAGLLDSHWDPTRLYYAAQSWQAVVSGPDETEPVAVEEAELTKLTWRDADGVRYLVWWRRSDDGSIQWTDRVALEDGAEVFDPLHARVLDIEDGARVPVCNWPLIARMK